MAKSPSRTDMRVDPGPHPGSATFSPRAPCRLVGLMLTLLRSRPSGVGLSVPPSTETPSCSALLNSVTEFGFDFSLYCKFTVILVCYSLALDAPWHRLNQSLACPYATCPCWPCVFNPRHSRSCTSTAGGPVTTTHPLTRLRADSTCLNPLGQPTHRRTKLPPQSCSQVRPSPSALPTAGRADPSTRHHDHDDHQPELGKLTLSLLLALRETSLRLPPSSTDPHDFSRSSARDPSGGSRSSPPLANGFRFRSVPTEEPEAEEGEGEKEKQLKDGGEEHERGERNDDARDNWRGKMAWPAGAAKAVWVLKSVGADVFSHEGWTMAVPAVLFAVQNNLM